MDIVLYFWFRKFLKIVSKFFIQNFLLKMTELSLD